MLLRVGHVTLKRLVYISATIKTGGLGDVIETVKRWMIQMDVPGSYVGRSPSALCEDTEAGCSCVFGLLVDKAAALTDDNQITVAPVTSAHAPEKGRKICKDVRSLCWAAISFQQEPVC